MDLNIISKLPEGKFVIGAREIKKAVETGSVKKIIVASNCPDFLVKKFAIDHSSGDRRLLVCEKRS